MFVWLFIHKCFVADISSLGSLLALYLAIERRSAFWFVVIVGCFAGVFAAET